MICDNCDGLTRRLARVEKELDLTTRELTDTYEEISAIYRFSDALSTEIHIDVLCEKLTEEISSTLDADNVSVQLIDPVSGDLVTVASRGAQAGQCRDHRWKRGEGIPWYVSETKKPIIVCDVTKHPDHAECPHTRVSLMAAPIIAKGATLGIICVSDKFNNAEFLSNELKLLTTIANQAAIALENAKLYRNLENMFVSIVRSFAAAIDAKSSWTAGHSERVTTYSVAIAEALEVDRKTLEELRTCGLLHDVGKIGIPEQILDKRDPITNPEYLTIMQHAVKGARILEHIHTFEKIIPGIRYHHERWDGQGTPDGLKGENIPLIARILSVADAYDAITSDRPYRDKRGKEEAIEEIKRCSGTQFDPVVVAAFLAAVAQQTIT